VLNGLDLFSGIGGISVALNEWVRPIAYCEIDPYCQGVLLNKMAHKLLPVAPIWDDIRSLDGNCFGNSVHIIYGGFPCQDISIASNGKGLEGERSGLFFEIVRLSKEIKPQFIFLENVPAITTRGGLRVVREIAEMGYDCRWCVISAASVGAMHRRERWFLLANTLCARLQIWKTKKQKTKSTEHENWWTVEPSVGRVGDGIPFRVDRVKALGNAVVPIQANEAFKILMGLK
jgi:DNA (cytosine-5)-methyltransferase 1